MTGPSEPLVGGGILDLVTVGMYSDPLAIYREYIQNSADALAVVEPHRGLIQIRVDLSGGRVRIRDNGPGLSYSDAVRSLLPIGRSAKHRGHDRGFRGIGRLSGLAFADTVAFLTRATGNAPVTRVKWDGLRLRGEVLRSCHTDDVIRACVEVSIEPGQGYPDHFFDVEIEGVGRQAASQILNRDRVRRYIAEVCPVPVPSEFGFSSEIAALFTADSTPLAIPIVVEGEPAPITRGYHDLIQFGNGREDSFHEFEGFRIPTAEGNGVAAVGWIAHSSYLGAIPKDIGIRGIRARCGNIQVGDETVFDDVFQEERFNRWCVGEVHVLDPRVLPNGRRDYFEPGPHIRNIENRLNGVFRGVMARCRSASSIRNKERRLSSEMTRLEEICDLADSGYLAVVDAMELATTTKERVDVLRLEIERPDDCTAGLSKRLDVLADRLRHFQPPVRCLSLDRLAPSEMDAYRKVFRVLAKTSPSARVAIEIIEAVLADSP